MGGGLSRALLLAPLVLSGCPYKVALSSVPGAADVELPDGSHVITPAEVRFRWVPFGHQRIVAVTAGYRPLELDLRRDEIRWARFVFGTLRHPGVLLGEPRGDVRLILVPDHGPAGTWTEEELPR